MEVSGLVISSSEVLRFDHEEGILFTLFNPIMKFNFYILAHDVTVEVWRRVYVNHCYIFSALKPGVLETSSGVKHILLKTTLMSTCDEVERQELSNFEIADELKAIISIPSFDSSPEHILKYDKCDSPLISYQGFITSIKDSFNGVFELDNKVTLYATFNISCLYFNDFKKGSEYFISNAHLIKSYKGESIIVCCGLSSVRNILEDELHRQKVISPTINFCIKNSLSINDFLWFERLISRLTMKFSSLSSEGIFLVEKDTNLFDNILDFFLSFHSEDEVLHKKPYGLADEYFSFPHECAPFSKNRLPVMYDVPYLSDILDEALTNSCFIDASKDWKISVTKIQNSVLVGKLYVSQYGTFYISDDTTKLPVVIGPICPYCSHEENITTKLNDSNTALIVGCYDYDVIVESIYCKNLTSHCFQYIRTSCCKLFLLDSLNNVNKKVNANNKFSYPGFVSHSKDNSEDNISEDDNNLNVNQSGCFVSFLVLSKLKSWHSLASSNALVLFHPEKCLENNSWENETFQDDSFNFYETEDDFEFACLVNKLSLLCIEEKSRLGQLCFESEKFCNNLFTKHIYTIDPKSLYIKNNNSLDGLMNLKVSSAAKITYSNCLEKPDCFSGLVRCCSVKEIVLSKKLSRNCFVVGVLVDKLYKVSKAFFNGKLKEAQSASFCIVIRDMSSQDTIPVYLPYIPKTTAGLLPGVYLELYGFFCSCSQNGTFYLKASKMFGIEIGSEINPCSSVGNSFSSQCFIVKIMSASIFSICADCSRKFKESCFCINDSKVHIKVSALIDTGHQQLPIFCYNDTARKILALQEQEWICLVSFIEQNHETLKFSDKMNTNQIRYFPVMNQIFFYYCISKSIYQQLHLECVRVFNTVSNRIDLPTIWCKSAVDYASKDFMTEYYLNLKKSDME